MIAKAIAPFRVCRVGCRLPDRARDVSAIRVNGVLTWCPLLGVDGFGWSAGSGWLVRVARSGPRISERPANAVRQRIRGSRAIGAVHTRVAGGGRARFPSDWLGEIEYSCGRRLSLLRHTSIGVHAALSLTIRSVGKRTSEPRQIVVSRGMRMCQQIAIQLTIIVVDTLFFRHRCASTEMSVR
jgi:hypothetical protein